MSTMPRDGPPTRSPGGLHVDPGTISQFGEGSGLAYLHVPIARYGGFLRMDRISTQGRMPSRPPLSLLRTQAMELAEHR